MRVSTASAPAGFLLQGVQSVLSKGIPCSLADNSLLYAAH